MLRPWHRRAFEDTRDELLITAASRSPIGCAPLATVACASADNRSFADPERVVVATEVVDRAWRMVRLDRLLAQRRDPIEDARDELLI